jgi:hypothetical protein
MKVCSIIFLCLAFKNLSSQTIPVFQILYAEKASLSNGTPLKTLDKLLDETIHVADSGYLVLIHETGIPVEVSGDTTIMLNDVHSVLNPPSKKMSSSYQNSLGVNYLFISELLESKKYRLERTRAVRDDRLVRSVYPPLINGLIYFDDDVKVVWQRGFIGMELDINVVNVFDEKLKSSSSNRVNDSTLLISKEELVY